MTRFGSRNFAFLLFSSEINGDLGSNFVALTTMISSLILKLKQVTMKIFIFDKVVIF